MSNACPQFGFTVEFDLVPDLAWDESRRLRDALMTFAAARGLVCDDRGSPPRWSLVVRSESSQATDADRRSIADWASTRREITATRLGLLVDLQDAA
jgi:hypothetical protein